MAGRGAAGVGAAVEAARLISVCSPAEDNVCADGESVEQGGPEQLDVADDLGEGNVGRSNKGHPAG